MSTEVQSI